MDDSIRYRILHEFYQAERKGQNFIFRADLWAREWGVATAEITFEIRYLVNKGWLKGEYASGTDLPVLAGITPQGVDALMEHQNELTTRLDGSPKSAAEKSPKTVFVVHGRNERLRKDLFLFLQTVGLEPFSFSEAIKLTRKTAPYIGEVLDAAFEAANAVIVLLTPDDEARLRADLQQQGDPPSEKELTPQPRQNVLFEAGLAFGYNPDHTILVKVGNLRPFSDVHGRHEVRLSNELARRQELVDKLRTAGCPVETTDPKWQKTGNFDTIDAASVPAPSKKLTLSEAEQIAIEFVGKKKPDSADVRIDSAELKDNHWNVSGAYSVTGDKIAGTIGFNVIVNADSGDVVKFDFYSRGLVGVG